MSGRPNATARFELWGAMRRGGAVSGYRLLGRYETFPQAAAAAHSIGGGLYRVCAVGGGNVAVIRLARLAGGV